MVNPCAVASTVPPVVVMVLIPVAVAAGAEAGALDCELEAPEPLDPDDPVELLPLLPHAASPMTPAARAGITHHRLRIVSLSYRYGIYEAPYTHGLRTGPPISSRRIRIGFGCDAAAQPGQRQRVPVLDGTVGRVEQLEPDDLVGDAYLTQGPAECFGSQVEEVLVPGARVDPDRPQRPERLGVPGRHPDRVPVLPPLPDLRAQRPGPRVEGQLNGPV